MEATRARRDQQWAALAEGPFDLLIIGGGITGAGIARDASRRGLKVALVEMNDLAFGTSSRSSKLVHGGLRYLEKGQIPLVFESVNERELLKELAPHLVRDLGFLFPVYGSRLELTKIFVGMALYDGLAFMRSPTRHRRLSAEQLLAEEPLLSGAHELRGSPLYYDCATDDARLTLESAVDAVTHGAVVATRARVRALRFDHQGRVRGARVESTIGSDSTPLEVEARAVINATGPWTDAIRRMAPRPGREPRRMLRPTKGVHIVVSAERLPVKHAVVIRHPEDGRVLFAIPWGEETYIGTTDTDDRSDPAEVHATLDDVDYLLAAANATFPPAALEREDVISTWAGLRPLVAPDPNKGEVDESAVSREHEIEIAPSGLLTIAGGKLTTYRRMAGEVVDETLMMLRRHGEPLEARASLTGKVPLPGGVEHPGDEQLLARVLKLAPALCERSARLLVRTYGVRADALVSFGLSRPRGLDPIIDGRPELWAQVDWAIEHELAATVTDVLLRRTQVYYRDPDQGLGAASAVASRMADLLGWDERARAASLAEYEREVALSRRWRSEFAAVPADLPHAAS